MALDKVTTGLIADDAVSTDQIANNAVISTSGAITTTGAFTSIGIDDNSNANAITIDSSERVGVGTATPENLLHIENSGSVFAQIESTNNADTGVKLIRSGTGNGDFAIFNDGGDLKFSSANDLASAADATGTDLMTVKGSGNVGIGTTSPDYTLEVESASSPTISLKDTTNDCIAYLQCDNTNGYVGTRSAHKFNILVENSERIQISPLGKIGIGASSLTDPASPAVYIKAVGASYANDSDGLKIQGGNANRRIISCADYYDSVKWYLEADGGSSPDVSDKRFKRNITDLKDEFPDVLSTINNIVPKRFNMVKDLGDYNSDPKDKFSYGVLAQDLESLLPDLAYFSGDKDGEDRMKIDDETKMDQPAYNYFFDKGSFNFLLLLAIQELSAKVTALE